MPLKSRGLPQSTGACQFVRKPNFVFFVPSQSRQPRQSTTSPIHHQPTGTCEYTRHAGWKQRIDGAKREGSVMVYVNRYYLSKQNLPAHPTHLAKSLHPPQLPSLYTLANIFFSPTDSKWVSLVIPATSVPLLEPSDPTTVRKTLHTKSPHCPKNMCSNLLPQGRSALLRPVVNQPTPESVQRESISSVPVVETESSVPFVSKPVTSHGEVRVSPVKCVSLPSPSTLPTTSWSEQTP